MVPSYPPFIRYLSHCRSPKAKSPFPSDRFRTAVTVFFAWLCCSSITPAIVFAQPGVERNFFQQYILQQKTEKVFRDEVVARSHDTVERVKQVCQLEPAQLEKLQLAAEGDVTRFFREYERVKMELAGFKVNDAQAFQRAWPIVMPLNQRIQQKIFDENSLCQSVVKAVLNESQRKQFETAEAKRRAYEHEANCKSTIAELNKEIPFTSAQRAKLLEIMLSVPPPKKSHPQLASILGMIILKKVSKQIEMESGLDKKQLDHLLALLQRVRGMEGNFQW